MASITFDRITKRYPDGTQAVTELDLDEVGRVRTALPVLLNRRRDLV